MPHPPPHPTREQLSLSLILDALRDPIRCEIVLQLADCGSAPCADFAELSGKTNLSYHLARLREAGVINVRLDGPQRIASLRWSDLQARFPALLESIIAAARAERELAKTASSGSP